MSVSFLGLTSKNSTSQPFKAETAGSIAFNSKPQLFRQVETAGSIAVNTSSAGTSSSASSSGSSCNVCA